MRSTFRILFYVNRQKIKKNGMCPVMGRITLDGKVSQYSTGEEITPGLWDTDKGRAVVRGKNLEEDKHLKSINRQLDELDEKAKLAYKKSIDTAGYVSSEVIKNAVTNRAQAKEALLGLFDEHNEEYAKRVGIDRVHHTCVRYLTTRKHLYNFLQYKHGLEDIPLRSLDMQFINDFHFYLSTVLQQKTVKRDPFSGYKLDIPPIEHRYLTGEQLSKIMRIELPTYRLCHTRDLFVFSTFTGLGRAELANLSSENIITENDGSRWIYIARQKTKTECRIKLLDIPVKIMEKYKGDGKNGKLFFVPVTSNLCRSLKMIADICKLDCHLTFYMSRHTYATEVCLSNGVPIETISRMMGHANIRTTQIYAEITNQKVKRDFDRLSEQTKDLYSIPEDNMPVRVYQSGRYSGWKENKDKSINKDEYRVTLKE